MNVPVLKKVRVTFCDPCGVSAAMETVLAIRPSLSRRGRGERTLRIIEVFA